MKKTIKTVMAVTIIAAAGYAGHANQKKVRMSDIMVANVEALASGEDGTIRYCTMHVACFDTYGSPTGKYTASSYIGETCPYTSTHDHYCTTCKSRS